MAKYLVTGGSGFIGGAVVRALALKGEFVRVFDSGWRQSTSALTDLGDLAKRIEVITGDIRDRSAVAIASQGMDSILHLAAVNGTKNFYEKPDLVLSVGVEGIVNVLYAVKESKVPHLVVMSSSEVYQSAKKIPTDETAELVVPDPLNPRFSYGCSKMISEMMALHTSTASRTCIVRPHNVYGPRMGFDHVIPQFVDRLAKIQGHTFSIQGSGRETRSFCYIDDFVNGFLIVLDRGVHKNIYHVGTEDEVSIMDLAKLVARVAGREIEVVAGPLTQGSTLRRCPDISKLKALGFLPKFSLEEGLSRTVSWYFDQAKTNTRRAYETSQA